MSEAELREGLRAAVGDEPPLDFDPDALIRRAQQARRRRRALVAVAVATLALTGSVLSLPGVFERRPGLDAADGSVLTTTANPAPSPQPSAWVAPPPAVTPYSTDQRSLAAPGARTYLAAYLGTRFAQVVPGVKVVEAQFPESAAEPGHHIGWVTFVDGEGTSQVVVRLDPPPLPTTPDAFCADSGCGTPVRRADGSYLASSAAPAKTGDGRFAGYTVVHFRPDGSVVQVTGYNYDPTTGAGLRPRVAVTVDQLVELATDPKLGP
ncbi:MAG: hypothetical protein HOV94_35165 [Saccharothrix sp.]|nr:hypothetical protein [Saccharothrix sp.]